MGRNAPSLLTLFLELCSNIFVTGQLSQLSIFGRWRELGAQCPPRCRRLQSTPTPAPWLRAWRPACWVSSSSSRRPHGAFSQKPMVDQSLPDERPPAVAPNDPRRPPRLTGTMAFPAPRLNVITISTPTSLWARLATPTARLDVIASPEGLNPSPYPTPTPSSVQWGTEMRYLAHTDV